MAGAAGAVLADQAAKLFTDSEAVFCATAILAFYLLFGDVAGKTFFADYLDTMQIIELQAISLFSSDKHDLLHDMFAAARIPSDAPVKAHFPFTIRRGNVLFTRHYKFLTDIRNDGMEVFVRD